jgi:hypothetical protein
LPGARLESFRRGDSAERLAEFILGSFAFTAAVPRQEDVGHDFHCVLTIRDSETRMLRAGPFFSVQVKSTPGPVRYAKSHEVDWIVDQENPFFLCVADRENLRCDVYSTWNRLNAFTHHGRLVTELLPDEPLVQPTLGNDQVLRIPLGPPVVSLTAQESVGDAAGRIGVVMRDWIELDRRNIVNNHAGMHWIQGPTTWVTNKRPGADQWPWFYWNSKNLQACIDNFGRSAVGLLLTIEKARSDGIADVPTELVRDLETAYAAFAPAMDPRIQGIFAHAKSAAPQRLDR